MRCIFWMCVMALCAGAAQAVPCEALTTTTLDGGAITSARVVSDQTNSCRVKLVLRPTKDSDIKVEIWMPVEGWNGKFQANGNGGWSGSINSGTLAKALAGGYATAMSDLGHEGSSASFALGHPEKLADFGYRASHLMTVAAKTIIERYYGRPPQWSYWVGCSAGGRQALMEAQRYPNDFDGIIAGAPGMNWTGRALQSIWVAQAMHADDSSYVPPTRYGVIHRAVLTACDALDGLKDGILEDPTRCSFDPKELECKASSDGECLNGAQAAAVAKVYAEHRNANTRRLIFPGLTRGSELGWATMGGPEPLKIGVDLFRYVVFKNPEWAYQTFRFDQDVDRTELAENGVLNATDPNLKEFFARGGKLLQYHGWSDPQIPPGFSVEYYRNVVQLLGQKQAEASYRLYMVPGMAHCGGGEGTSSFDMLSALEGWVEHGRAPERIKASRVNGGSVDRTRPLCSYPKIAVYRGSGDVNDEASFVCKE
jgi:feruloyl esterase